MVLSCIYVVDIRISVDHKHPSVGQHYELRCDTIGVEHNPQISVNYTWIKDNVTIPTEPNTLILSPIKMSDAGHYVCTANIMFNNQSQQINATHDLYLQSK